ncbi:hypothetical protein FACS189493_8640 [Spirochaetia bacterium]|nr:hypothetical protein FACS189493_8640 [Spirochaetia bacterium]
MGLMKNLQSKFGGMVDRAVLTGKKYTPPKTAYCGEGWQAVFFLRVTVEGLAV